jgi:hypothetical protein
VVVFDDFAYLAGARSPIDQSHEESQGIQDGDDFGRAPETLEPPTSPPAAADDEAGVDIKRLSDAFAEKGLVCGFLKPGPQESQDEAQLLIESARRADITILDWSINRDQGQTAQEIITALLKQDRELTEARLRLIAIYTSQRNLDQILQRVEELLRDAEADTPPERDGYTVTSGPMRVVILAKQTAAVAGEDAAQRVSEEDLPQRLIEAFAEFTMGLVPNVVLAGLAAVRTDTYRILQRLDRGLDPAYLGQRLLLDDPTEAEDQLVELLTAEVGSVMEDRQIGIEANEAAITDWIRWQREANRLATWRDDDEATATAEIDSLLREGLAAQDQTVVQFRERKSLGGANRAHIHAGNIFAESSGAGEEATKQFAMRLSLRTHYSNPDRTLELGTIVHSDDGYLLCVQPVCDSVRLDEERDFPFLPLREEADRFDLVVLTSDGHPLGLRLAGKPHQLKQIRFRPDAEKRCVVARAEGGGWIFTDMDNRDYTWVARLQIAHGQRIVHTLGADFGRVGLSESEWLRRISHR